MDANSSFELLDLIALQRYLLGIDKPVALAAGDMDENGDVDIFDLSLMKRILLHP